MQPAQKVVISIGLGIALMIVGACLVSPEFRGAPGGWFGYAPGSHPIDVGSTSTYFLVRRVNPWRLVGIPLALVVGWTAFATWLFGTPRHLSGSDS